jgi:hypothetical protein
MTTVELVRNGIESTIISPEQGGVRVQLQYRVLGHGHAESIQIDVILPDGDRSLSALQSEAIGRAQELLERFQTQHQLEQTQTLSPVAAEAQASLSPPPQRKAAE